MDVSDLRGLATVLCMVSFLAVVAWAYAPGKKDDFDEAANLSFDQDGSSKS